MLLLLFSDGSEQRNGLDPALNPVAERAVFFSALLRRRTSMARPRHRSPHADADADWTPSHMLTIRPPFSLRLSLSLSHLISAVRFLGRRGAGNERGRRAKIKRRRKTNGQSANAAPALAYRSRSPGGFSMRTSVDVIVVVVVVVGEKRQQCPSGTCRRRKLDRNDPLGDRNRSNVATESDEIRRWKSSKLGKNSVKPPSWTD